MASEKIKVGGYIRVSTKQQAKEGESLEDQRNSIIKYCKLNDFTLYKIYADEGVSGSKEIRPALEEMKKDAEKGLFSKIVFCALDRFGRNAEDTLSNYKFFEQKKGITLYSIKEGIDTSTPVGKLTRTILAGIAEMEKERIRERTLVGQFARAEGGQPIGRISYGYSWDEENKRFVWNPKEAEVYKRIVNDFLVKNKSLLRICNELNAEGLLTRYKRKWTNPSMAEVLRNPIYLGNYKNKIQGKTFELPAPPLIDKRHWDIIQERIRENIRKPRNYDPNSPFLLRGLLKCGECGYGLAAVTNHSKNRTYRCWKADLHPSHRGSRNLKPGKERCDLPVVKAEEIEDYVLGAIMGYFQFPENIFRVWKEKVSVDGSGKLEGELRSLNTKLGNLESRREKLLGLYLDGKMSKDFLQKQDALLSQSIEKMKVQIVEIKKKISEASLMKERLDEFQKNISDIKKFAPLLSKTVKEMSNQQKREFIEATLGGEKIEISITRVGDVAEKTKGISAQELAKPIYRQRNGLKVVDWKVDEGKIDFIAATDYLTPLIKNEYKTKLLSSKTGR